MKLLFLYGPPASGKLTISEKLSELTGIPLFHNHLSRDLVKDIYGDHLKDHYKLVDQIRFAVLDYCSQHQTDLIFTYVYEGTSDDENVKRYVSAIEDNGGEVAFIELTAFPEDLVDRVDNESRKKFKKLTDRETMTALTRDMAKYSIPFVEPLKINTSTVSADEAARLIIEALALPKAS